jgi:hypothetical protein
MTDLQFQTIVALLSEIRDAVAGSSVQPARGATVVTAGPGKKDKAAARKLQAKRFAVNQLLSAYPGILNYLPADARGLVKQSQP